MSTRRAQRVDALTDDVSTLSEKVKALHDDLERALEEVEDETTEDAAQPSSESAASEEIQTEVENDRARADGGNVGWSEIETAGPDGVQDADEVEWTSVETE